MLFLTDYTLRTVALGALTLGLVSGALGTFAVLRRQSLLGDAISHAALPGIALAFLLTGSKEPIVLMLGAASTGWLATLAVLGVTRSTRVTFDAALGMALSVFFGFGLMLLTFIQRRPDATQAGLDKFLFGQAATLLQHDVVTMATLGAVALLVLVLCWKEFELVAFDPEFGRAIGLPMRAIDILLTTLLVVAIVIGLQMVGVVLMSAMIVAPAAAARQWTDRLGVMVVLSAALGAGAGLTGALASSAVPQLPTGPTIVLMMSGVVIVSFLVAPNRGLIWRQVRDIRRRRTLALDAVLLDLHQLAVQHADPTHPHNVSALESVERVGGVRASLGELAERGFVRRTAGDLWSLTPEGIAEARRLDSERGGVRA